MSMKMLSTNVGMVIFVGIAARFTINTIPIAIIADIHNTKLLPLIPTANITTGAMMQPCAASERANQPNRFFSCALHHLKSFSNKKNRTGVW